MSPRQPQYSKDEFARMGDEIYYSDIYPQLQSDSIGKIVAVDIVSGAWEIDKDEISASTHLEERYPNAQIWLVKVGSRYVRRFGGSRSQKVKVV